METLRRDALQWPMRPHREDQLHEAEFAQHSRGCDGCKFAVPMSESNTRVTASRGVNALRSRVVERMPVYSMCSKIGERFTRSQMYRDTRMSMIEINVLFTTNAASTNSTSW